MELADHVDENDEVIGQIDIKEFSRRDLIHRSSFVFLFNTRGELLLQKRSPNVVNCPDTWAAPAGYVGAGETYEENARRELEEEMNLVVPLKRVLKTYYDLPMNRAFATLFKGEYNGTAEDIEFDEDEVAEVKFMPLEDIQEDMAANPSRYSLAFAAVFKEYLKTIPSC